MSDGSTDREAVLTDNRVERRLAAILAAEVAGYSRLTGLDEEGTHVRLRERLRGLAGPKISEHRGKVVKHTGDGVLAEFGSVVDAVRCAIEVQRGMAEQNATMPQVKRIEFRIGIHVGDIIVDHNDIFGDGVNIAARLEGIAEPGGVCISDDAQRQVRGKVDFDFEDMGPQNLKNIVEPMRAWRLSMNASGSTAASIELPVENTQALALPDKPSIAVLPFQNMSGDPEQDYFADGLVDDIITALSRFRGLFVIARHSSFTYKGKAIDIKQVGRELGVRYVLEGSVRQAGRRVRIAGQLIDVATGAHLWADRFDGPSEDIFDLQDKVTQKVVGAIAPELDRAEIERARRRPIGNVDAVTAFYRGLPHVHFPTTSENNDAALRDFETAMALDPSFAPAYGGVAACLGFRRANRWPGDIAKDDAELLRLAERIKELGTDDAATLSNIGFNLYWIRLEFDAGVEMVERAIQANPNYAGAYNLRGNFRVWDGESDTAIADYEKAMRLSPRDAFNYNAMNGIGLAHHNAGRHAEAALWTDKAARAFPAAFFVGLPVAILCYVGAERLADAKKLMAECLRLRPQWRRSNHVAPGWVRSPELKAKLLDACIQAGLPD
jgi:TolB-like protein/class 3 adenylate cyclase/tetratricopeptide (TPR) repeat protein